MYELEKRYLPKLKLKLQSILRLKKLKLSIIHKTEVEIIFFFKYLIYTKN